MMKNLKRIFRLLSAEERKKASRMAISVLCSTLLDFAGLAALLPVLHFLLQAGERDEAALFFTLLAVGVILLKCVLTTCLVRYQNQCLLSFYRRLSFSLFSSYYNRGLLFVRGQGSNKLAYEINAMCYSFSHNLLGYLCRMVGDGLLIVLVTLALLIWKGGIVLILFAAFIPFTCFYFFCVRKRVREYGINDMNAKREQARVVSDAFRGYVELEVNGAFPALQRSFLQGMDKISRNRMQLDMLLRLPLFLSELSVVVGLTMLLFFGKGDASMLVGVFAVASFRLLPALRAMLTGWTQIQNSICCLDVLEEGLKDYKGRDAASGQDLHFEREISIEGLTYAYPNGELILRDFDCRILKGEYVGFRGTSGVGKSTLFNLLIGLIYPDAGVIKVDGIPLTRDRRDSWMRQIGYVPQDVFVFNGTLAENVALGCEEIDYRRVDEVLEKVSLGRWVNSLPDGVDTVLSEAGGKLSGGERQRVGIARALYRNASVLLLDEATSALDNETEREVNSTLQRLKEGDVGLTILSIAHRESSLRFCDRIITIEK